MKPATVRRVTSAAIGFVVLLIAGGIVLSTLTDAWSDPDMKLLYPICWLAGLAFVISGSFIARREPTNAIGWIFLVIAVGWAATPISAEYGIYGLMTNPGSVPLPAASIALSEQVVGFALFPMILVLLLFPDGRPVSRGWRPVIWITAVTLVPGAVIGTLTPHDITDTLSSRLSKLGLVVRSPLGIEALRGLRVGVFIGLLIGILAITSIASLFVRRRRASREQREQLRWLSYLALATAIWIVGFLVLFANGAVDGNGPVGSVFWLFVSLVVPLGIPISCGIAILKYRLYDIDVVIRKTVVFAVVAFVLTALYLGVIAVATIGGVSRLLVGAVLLVVTFRPVRAAARSFADRIAYGKRASAYEVLAGFSERMSETYATDDVLPRMAHVLANATGAESARVWLRIGDEFRPAAEAGDAAPSQTLLVVDDALPDMAESEVTEVRHQGELLGALSVVMPANDPLDPGREKLIRDLAAQAGLVLRNVRLIEELKASRQRLVAAQDDERRKIERNIHDGAQQQLVALAVKQRLAASLIGKDDERARDMIEQLQTATTDALEDLRDLARGIYPPLLADKGLAAALEAQARKAALPVAIEPEGVGRYPQQIESAVYFSVLEALQNIAKYAGASHATVRLGHDGDGLTFEVVDDGRGFDTSSTGYGTGLQGIADRLAALDGELTVSSTPGTGTSVVGRVPAREGSA